MAYKGRLMNQIGLVIVYDRSPTFSLSENTQISVQFDSTDEYVSFSKLSKVIYTLFDWWICHLLYKYWNQNHSHFNFKLGVTSLWSFLRWKYKCVDLLDLLRMQNFTGSNFRLLRLTLHRQNYDDVYYVDTVHIGRVALDPNGI